MRNLYLVLALALAVAVPAGLTIAAESGDAGPRPAAGGNAGAAAPTAGAAATPEVGAPRGHPGHEDREGRGMGGMEGRPRAPGIFRDATPEEIADVLAFTGEYLPWVRAELEKVQKSDPQRFRQMCRRLRFEVAQLRKLQERDKEAFAKALEERQLRVRCRDLAAKVRASTDPKEKETLTAELRKTLGQLFDAEMVVREAHIRMLEERIKEFQNKLREQIARREDIVKRRLDDMLKGPPKSVSERPAGPSAEPPPPPTEPKSESPSPPSPPPPPPPPDCP